MSHLLLLDSLYKLGEESYYIILFSSLSILI
uniref:Uncharacterized protein n=1 Tax=Rhizophora mucronata TaxID=61149 RepID=A0A2P2QYH6_RHIMU